MLPHAGFRQVGGLLQIEIDHAGADIGAADIDGENGVEALEQPFGREMGGADQARLIRIVADRHQVDRDTIGLEDEGCAADRQFTDAAAAETAADHQTLRILPGFEFEKPPNDEREFLREILDGGVHDAGRFRVAFGERLVQFFFREVFARRIAKRVVALFAQRLAPILDDVTKGAFAGAVADKAFVVLDLDIVAVDLDGGQAGAAVGGDHRQSRCVRHEKFPR